MKVFHKILIVVIAVIIIAVASSLLIVNKLLGPAQKEASEKYDLAEYTAVLRDKTHSGLRFLSNKELPPEVYE